MTFKEQILAFRAKHGLTQTEMSEFLGVSRNMCHRYERELSKPTARNRLIFEQKMEEANENENVQM